MDTGVKQKLHVVSARGDDRRSPQGWEIFDRLLKARKNTQMKSLNYASDISLKTSSNAPEQVVARGCALNFTQNLLGLNWGLVIDCGHVQ